MKQTPKEDHDLLYESLLQLNNVEECRRFMEDLCTVTELKAMRQRIEVAMYLREGMIYQDILKHTGASSATISRVNRCPISVLRKETREHMLSNRHRLINQDRIPLSSL